MRHVFISYVRENQQQVDQLKEELRSAGVEVWLDREQILPGQRWRLAIRQAIQGGMFFIACFSREYVNRSASYMNEEITLAIEVLRSRSTDGAWFIPVLLSECSIPDRDIGAGETLRDFQWVNLQDNWRDGVDRVLRVMGVSGKAKDKDQDGLPENGGMGMAFYATYIQAELMRNQENAKRAYGRMPDTVRFWAIIGLVGGASSRLVHGASRGYLLAETISSLAKEVVAPYEAISIVKEFNGVVLLSASSLRPLLEALVLTDQVAIQMNSLGSDEQVPFEIRGGISSGAAKKITKAGGDFIGTPLDQLSRLLDVRSNEANLFLTEAAYTGSQPVVQEYSKFLSVSEPRVLSSGTLKGVIAPVHYRELRINRGEFAEFRGNFEAWRNPERTAITPASTGQ